MAPLKFPPRKFSLQKHVPLLFTLTVLLALAGVSPHPAFPATGAGKPGLPRLVVQTGTDDDSGIFISPNGKNAIVQNGYHLEFFDIATGRKIVSLIGHMDLVRDVAFSPDGLFALSCGADHDDTTKYWDLRTGEIVRSEPFAMRKLLITRDGRYGIGRRGWDYKGKDTTGTITAWELRTGKIIWEVKCPGESHDTPISLAGDGSRIYAATRKGTIQVLETKSGRLRFTIPSKLNEIFAIVELHDAAGLIVEHKPSSTGTNERAAVSMIELPGGATVWKRTYQEVKGISLSPDSQFMLVEAAERSADTSKTSSFFERISLQSGTTLTRTLSTAGIWDVKWNPPVLPDDTPYRAALHSLDFAGFANDDKFLVTKDNEGIVTVWNLETGRAASISDTSARYEQVALSADGKSLFAATDDRVDAINLLNGVRRTLGKGSGITAFAVSSDQTSLAFGWGDGLTIKSIPEGAKTKVLSRSEWNVNSLVFSPDGNQLLMGSNDDSLKMWRIPDGKIVRKFAGHFNHVHRVALSANGQLAASAGRDSRVILWDTAKGRAIATLLGHDRDVCDVSFSPDSKRLVSAGFDRTVRVWDLEHPGKARVLTGHVDIVNSAGFSGDGKWAVSAGEDGTTIIWDPASGSWLAKLYTFTDGSWAVVDPDGRFDTDNLEKIRGLHWIMPDAPFTPLPLEIFMRDYYEPGLLPRLLRGERFAPVRNLAELNRVQPEVKILSIAPGSHPDTVSVEVEVARAEAKYVREGKEEVVATGAQDLRLFRDGQLVGSFPEDGGVIPLSPLTGKAVATFRDIRLPHDKSNGTVEISAYAFNDSRIKSATDRKQYQPPPPSFPLVKKAFVIAVGVERYEDQGLDLAYAGKDATTLLETTTRGLKETGIYDSVVPVALVSDSGQNRATKRHLLAVLDRLAGKEVPKELIATIPGGENIARATPDDTVILAFSGHGYLGEHGVFYFLLHDTGGIHGGSVSPELLRSALSSDELAVRLRDVDAGELDMVVDACHSSATVEGEGFKPGPMGSRGLGQLAYDKGMRILAASRAVERAWEYRELGHGILTYALAEEGLQRGKADYRPLDRRITLAEWLSFGAEQVPVIASGLQREGRSGKAVRRSEDATRGKREERSVPDNIRQQPVLFDFTRGRMSSILSLVPPGGKQGNATAPQPSDKEDSR